MSQAPQTTRTIEIGSERLPVPKGSTLKQVALAREILCADLTKDSWQDIFERAGYSRDTARSDARDIRERPGVQRATEALVAARRDSGKEIHRSSLSELARRITPEARDELILGAVKVTGDLVKDGIGSEDEGVDDATRQHARDYISKVVRCTIDLIASKVVSDNMDVRSLISAQDIESIVVAAETCELTEYTLSDAASPPTRR